MDTMSEKAGQLQILPAADWDIPFRRPMELAVIVVPPA